MVRTFRLRDLDRSSVTSNGRNPAKVRMERLSGAKPAASINPPRNTNPYCSISVGYDCGTCDYNFMGVI